MSDARIEHLVTHGTFSLDGGTWPVDNNVWLVGDDAEVIVIDPAHDAAAVAEAVADRSVVAVLLTHGHNDHIGAAAEFTSRVEAHLYLAPGDGMLWRATYPGVHAPEPLNDGASFTVAGVSLTAVHTPGHTPGSTCLYAPDLGVVFTGDTLFEGGPGATGRAFSSFDAIIDSIRTRLLVLPADTVVNTGHGPSTTIGAEAPHLEEWIARGH